MKRLICLAAFCAASAAQAQELPAIPSSLLNTAGAVCIKVSRGGGVTGAYVIVSTGNAQTDQEMVAWARQLRWDPAKPDDRMRDTWFPMPIAFGNVSPPALPPSCATPATAT